MAREERMKLIQQIEGETKSRVLVCILGDRRGLETRIASDIHPLFFNHLSKMGEQKSINLFLYSTGGLTIAGYGLVNLFREFTQSFQVIVPFRALSTATLIALGADSIIMTKMGQLSPIDPSVESPLGPQVQAPGQMGIARIVPVNVEDAISYLDLSKKEAGLKGEEALSKVFDRLSGAVHPLALGAVNRAREQISFLAKTLLSYHMKDQAKINKIVGTLTRERFSHDYLISRREAKDVVGLNILDVSPTLDNSIVKLYQEYEALLNLGTPYIQEQALGAAEVALVSFNRAVVESTSLSHFYRTTKEVKRMAITQPGLAIPMTGYQERVLDERWVEDNTI